MNSLCFIGTLAALHRASAWRRCLVNSETESMYEQHFGLSRNPFQSVAKGEAVFKGPEQARIIAALKTALTARDSIAIVTGPVGVGKTTIVQRALEEAAPARLVARLGRTPVASDELVDLLLVQFGVVREPTRRFECLKTFTRILNEHEEQGARIFIVIEDAERLGAELLEELEALTAADDGVSCGANIILMGPQKLDKLITKPALERLRQRIRLQQTLERFNAEEVESYLRHRIDAAGGDYDAIFEQGTAMMIRRCSGGIPRVINGLCETALTVTAENHMAQVTPKIVFKVAVDVFGMAPGEAEAAQAPKNVAVTKPAEPPAPRPAAAPQQAAKPPGSGPVRGTPAAIAMTAQPAATVAAAQPTPAVTTARPAPTVTAAQPGRAAGKPAGQSVPVRSPTAQPDSIAVPRAPKPPVKPAAAMPSGANGADKAAAATAPAKAVGPQAPMPNDNAAAKSRAAPAKPMPELPPKFKFADEIVVDKDTKPQLSRELRKPDTPAPPSLTTAAAVPKASKQKPATIPSVRPPDDIPTLGDSARVESITGEKEKPAAAIPGRASAAAAPQAEPDLANLRLQEPPAAVVHEQPAADEKTAAFAKVDHDMLDAALASLAVHDEEDGPDLQSESPTDAPEASSAIPEVTLDRAIEERRAAARKLSDPAELEKMAAELEQTQSLEEMSDKLAETLFGSEELEAISMQIREDAAPEESPVALESGEAAGTTAPARAPEPPAAPKPPAAPVRPVTAESSADPQSADAPPAARGPQPEPIENQFNTSMTATLKTLNTRNKAANEGEPDEKPGGLLGRLKGSFRS